MHIDHFVYSGKSRRSQQKVLGFSVSHSLFAFHISYRIIVYAFPWTILSNNVIETVCRMPGCIADSTLRDLFILVKLRFGRG